MTITTTSPIEVLEKSLARLHDSQNHVAKTLEIRRGDVQRATEALKVATERYESRARDAEAIDLGMIKYREAIERLKSLEKGSTIVENYSPQVMDDDDDETNP